MAKNYTLTYSLSMTANSASGYSQSQTGGKTLNITGVDQIATGRIDVAHDGDSTVMAAPGHGRFVYVRNLDDTNFIVLTFANENDDEAAVKVDAGNTFILAGDNSGGMADMLDAKDSALSLSLGDLKSITVDADTASCDVEIFVAEIA